MVQSSSVAPPATPWGPFPSPCPELTLGPAPAHKASPRASPGTLRNLTPKWLPGCSLPLSLALTTVISRPQRPQAQWPAAHVSKARATAGTGARVLPTLRLPSPSTCPCHGQSQLAVEGFYLTPCDLCLQDPPSAASSTPSSPCQAFSGPHYGLSSLGSHRARASCHPITMLRVFDHSIHPLDLMPSQGLCTQQGLKGTGRPCTLLLSPPSPLAT